VRGDDVEKGPDAFRTISEVADDLDLPQHVLRFWETRFTQIRPLKRGGGRRYYRPDDVDLLRGIRHLLYGEGYTIRGVQQILREQGLRHVQSVGRSVEVLSPKPAPTYTDADHPDHAQEGGFGRIFSLIPSLRGSREGEPELPRVVEVPLPGRSDGYPASGEEDYLRFRRTRGLVRPVIEEDERAHPAGEEATRLTPDQVRLLKTTLAELNECQRMLEAVSQEEP
jgi:DNA-binding transcriptional MerR regulator